MIWWKWEWQGWIKIKWLYCSIIVFNRLSWSLPLEVRSIILLYVPSRSWVHDIVSPTHSFSISDSIMKSWEANANIGEGIMGTPWLCHEITLVVSPASEADFPADSIKFVCRVAMNMLSLLHVNASNFVTLFLFFPWGGPGCSTPTSFHIKLLSFVWTYTLRVCFGEM